MCPIVHVTAIVTKRHCFLCSRVLQCRTMQKEQERSLNIQGLKNKIDSLDVVTVRNTVFKNLHLLFLLLSAESISEHDFTVESSLEIITLSAETVYLEQRLESFTRQVHLDLTMYDALNKPQEAAKYLLQAETLARILDRVATYIGESTHFYTTIQRIANHDVYINLEDSVVEQSRATLDVLEKMLTSQAISILSLIATKKST